METPTATDEESASAHVASVPPKTPRAIAPRK